MFDQICRGAAERRGRRAVRIALHRVINVRRRAAVLQQHRHQDRAVARQHVERRTRSLRIEEHLDDRAEPLAPSGAQSTRELLRQRYRETAQLVRKLKSQQGD